MTTTSQTVSKPASRDRINGFTVVLFAATALAAVQSAAACDHTVQVGQNIQSYINMAAPGDTICVVGNPPPHTAGNPLYPSFDLIGKQLTVMPQPGDLGYWVRGPILAVSGEPAGTTIISAFVQEGNGGTPLVTPDGLGGPAGGGIVVIGSHLAVFNSSIGHWNDPNLANNAAFGGGAYIGSGAHATFTNCEFSLNQATMRGGNIYVTGDDVTLILQGTQVGGGRALDGGGVASEVLSGTVLITSSTLVGGNLATHGGAIYNTYTGITVLNTLIAENFACTAGAGAAFANMTSPANFDGVLFWENRSQENGGGYAVFDGGHVNFTDCDFAGFNDAGLISLAPDCPQPPPMSGRGGAGYIDPNPIDVTMVNTTVFGSEAAEEGGGIYNESLIPITLGPGLSVQNSSAKRGGGIFNMGDLKVLSSLVAENEADLGGGAYNAGFLSILESSVAGNSAVDSTHTRFVGGGGIYQHQPDPDLVPPILHIEDSNVSENLTSDGTGPGTARGGGLHRASGVVEVRTSIFDSNGAGGGGGMYLGPAPAGSMMITIDRTRFIANASGGSGGAILTVQSSPLIANSLFVDNSTTIATTGGGIAANAASHPTIVNCTMYNNIAAAGAPGTTGHAIFAESSVVSLHNSIVWSDPAMPGAVEGTAASSFDVSHSNVVNGVMPGPGNTSVDPMFVSPGSFRLAPGSPLIDAGADTLLPAGLTLDLDNNPRIVGAAIDMGAFEDQGATCPWDLTGDGNVGVPDLLFLLSCWGPVTPGTPCAAANFTGSGSVGVPDLLTLLANWGPCP